jgi:septal ring factor EnvC (AmiA/AmiB activator)
VAHLGDGRPYRPGARRPFPYNKTKWARFRSGQELIPDWLLQQVVSELVPESRLREKTLATGRDLLEKAEQAAAGKVSELTSILTEQELQRRLDEARRGQIEAQKTLLGTMHLVMALIRLVHHLDKQRKALEGQAARDQRRLYQLRLTIAQKQLEQARAAREEAEDLHLHSHAQAEQYRRLLDADRDPLPLPPLADPTGNASRPR